MVQFIWNFLKQGKNKMTFHADDCLIEVAAWICLTVFVSFFSITLFILVICTPFNILKTDTQKYTSTIIKVTAQIHVSEELFYTNHMLWINVINAKDISCALISITTIKALFFSILCSYNIIFLSCSFIPYFCENYIFFKEHQTSLVGEFYHWSDWYWYFRCSSVTVMVVIV